jgi:hypothetical protein
MPLEDDYFQVIGSILQTKRHPVFRMSAGLMIRQHVRVNREMAETAPALAFSAPTPPEILQQDGQQSSRKSSIMVACLL